MADKVDWQKLVKRPGYVRRHSVPASAADGHQTRDESRYEAALRTELNRARSTHFTGEVPADAVALAKVYVSSWQMRFDNPRDHQTMAIQVATLLIPPNHRELYKSDDDPTVIAIANAVHAIPLEPLVVLANAAQESREAHEAGTRGGGTSEGFQR